MVKVIKKKDVLVYCPPVNEATKKWGVYAIPRMWREISGELVIRFNGEMDTADINNMQQAPNLYFTSVDEGETWTEKNDGENTYDINILTGIGSAYYKLKDGTILALRAKDNCQPIENIKHRKEFIFPNGEAILHSYRYGDIPDECKGIELLRYKNATAEPEVLDVVMDFPEREILVNYKAYCDNEFINEEGKPDHYIKVSEYVQPYIFKNPYLCDITELDDGTLVALSWGQNPNVTDRYCPEVYLLESIDGGVTWKKRGIVATDIDTMPYGYGGDAGEISLTRCSNGDLLCAMRMDVSIDPNVAKPICDVMVAASHDGGYTWDTPKALASGSVTPHIVALKDGIVFLVYGRPGVHFIYSEDNGKTWSKPQSIIGLTLEEERALGRSDADAKYFDTCSYSNTFVEKLSEDSVLVLYNNLKYDNGDGLNHKAAFVVEIELKKDE